MNTLQKVKHRVSNAERYVRWRLGFDTHPSVFFYTFHKCASSLFSGYVLRNVTGLRNVDYASRIYTGRDDGSRLQFEDTGHVYGPIRLSADPLSPVFQKLVAPTTTPEFVRGRHAVFLIRDPRDILVSAYYSFGVSHGLSQNPEIRARQEARREEIQQLTVDEYAIQQAPIVRANFENLATLSEACAHSVVLKYEDMIDDFDTFRVGLASGLPLSDDVLQQVHDQSRPADKENINVHRRSGRTGGYLEKLTAETIREVDQSLAPVLERFGYC